MDDASIDAVCDALSAANTIGITVSGLPRSPAARRNKIDDWREAAEHVGQSQPSTDAATQRFIASCQVHQATGQTDLILDVWTAAYRRAVAWSRRLLPLGVYLIIVWLLGLALLAAFTQTIAPVFDDFTTDLMLVPRRIIHPADIDNSQHVVAPEHWQRLLSTVWLVAAITFAVMMVWIALGGWKRLIGWTARRWTDRWNDTALHAEVLARLLDHGVDRDAAVQWANSLVPTGQSHPATQSTATQTMNQANWWRGLAENRNRWATSIVPVIWVAVLGTPIVLCLALALFVPLVRLYWRLSWPEI